MVRTALHPLGGGTIKIDTTPVRFDYTGAIQTYVVAKGVKKLLVDCVAAQGTSNNTSGGKGGRVQTTLKVKPGQLLYIYVGGVMPDYAVASYNASDIRTNNTGITDRDSLLSRIIVAGAGGNGSHGGDTGNSPGADGGGLVGASAVNGGTGGTQSQPGTGYSNGTLGLGGNAQITGQRLVVGGAGGAGLYGAGGGYTQFSASMGNRYRRAYGGGGGSSYTNEELCSEVIHTQGYNASGNGYIILTPLK